MKKLETAVACLALASVALAQTNSSSPTLEKRPATTATAGAGETASVAPDAAVITIDGLCERAANSSATAADCKTVITRAEFEKVVNPSMPPAQKKQVVDRYVFALVLAEKAHELGLDKGPQFDQQMYLARMSVLANLAGQHIQEEAAKVPDSEVEDYYHQHASDYRIVSFEKLYVPRQKEVDPATQKPNDPDARTKRAADEAAMKEEADKLRVRAAAGEDFTKLQQEAYDFGGYKQMKASNPRVDGVRKPGIPPAQAAILDLKKGDVSQVFSDTAGFVVYKIESVEDLPLAGVHDEIVRSLQVAKRNSAFDSAKNSVKTTLDDAYFGGPPPAAPPTLRNPGEAAPAAAPAPGKH